MTKPSNRKNAARKPRPPRATRVKIAISLPREHVAAAERAVNEGRVASVSAYVAHALERQADADSLGELIALMRAEDGNPSDDDYAWADAALGISGRSRKRATPDAAR
jgi:Arc/MetJ-type ribon-helix-helix transcriptional regulator